MNKLIRLILLRFGFVLYNVFGINFLSKRLKISIGENCKIINNNIKGIANLGSFTSVIENKLLGQITIGENSDVNNSTLLNKIMIGIDNTIGYCNFNGDISIHNNSVVSKSDLFGNILIGENCILKNGSLVGNIKIGENARIDGLSVNGSFSCMEYFKVFGTGVNVIGNVEIGKYTSLNGPNTDIFTSINKVKIGSFCSIARNVNMQEYNHKINRVSTYHIGANVFNRDRVEDIESKGDIIIENDVWIGTHCVILSGAHISNGVIIAANSVVNGYIPPYSIAAGSPAKVIKYRFSQETIDKLINLKWWDWSEELLKKNESFFTSNDIDFNKLVF